MRSGGCSGCGVAGNNRSGRHTDSLQYRHLYKTKVWQQLRDVVFARDRRICQLCGKPCHIGGDRHDPFAAVCDHIRDHNGDRDLFFDLNNLQTLHKVCHDKGKRNVVARGYDIAIGVDGWPTDPVTCSVSQDRAIS